MKYNVAHKFALEIDEETIKRLKGDIKIKNLEELREMIKKIRPVSWRGDE